MATKKKVSKKKTKVTQKPSNDEKVTPVGVETVDSVDTSNELLDRIAKLEKQISVLVKGLKWGGKEIAPIFGQGTLGAILQEVAAKVEAVE